MPEKPPAFRLYVYDLLSDRHVIRQTNEQFGSYVRLLCYAWLEEETGTLPDDDEVLAAYAKMTPDEWARNRAAIVRCFQQGDGPHDGKLLQKRMMSERQKQLDYSEQQAKAGRASGRKRRETNTRSTSVEPNTNVLGSTSVEPARRKQQRQRQS